MPLDSLGNKGPQQHLQWTLFCEILFCPAHVLPVVFASVSILLHQVCLSRPSFRFPSWFHSIACLVTLEAGSRRIWPIHLHFLFLISKSIWTCLVLFQRCSLKMTSGHLMFKMFPRPLLIKCLEFVGDGLCYPPGF